MTQPRKGIVGVGDANKAERNRNMFEGSKINDGEVGSGKVDNEFKKKGQKTTKSKNSFKSKKSSKSKKAIRSSDFLISGAKLAFTKLR